MLHYNELLTLQIGFAETKTHHVHLTIFPF